MTVHLPIERTLNEARDKAIDAVNRWRGHCVERYARLEDEVTTTLSAMASMSDAKVNVPHNFGDKVRTLRTAIAAEGIFSRPRLCKALESFETHLARRNMLVHATGKIWTDSKGDWLWRYRFQPSGKNSSIQIGYVEKDEAIEWEEGLARESRSLVDQLRTLRQSLKAVTE